MELVINTYCHTIWKEDNEKRKVPEGLEMWHEGFAIGLPFLIFIYTMGMITDNDFENTMVGNYRGPHGVVCILCFMKFAQTSYGK